MSISLTTRVLVRAATVLGCHRELLEAVSGGTLRFVGPSLPRPYADLAPIERERFFPLTGRPVPGLHEDDEFPSHRPRNAHTPVPSRSPQKCPHCGRAYGGHAAESSAAHSPESAA